MTKLYKLTNANWETKNHTKWGPKVTHTTSGEGELCGPGWLHAYLSPELAVLLNPIHAGFEKPILWEARGVVGLADGQLKVGTTRLTTYQQIPLPTISLEGRAHFAISCALKVAHTPVFVTWATNWMSGKDRSEAAAMVARSVTVWSARATAAEAAAVSAAWSTRAAAMSEAMSQSMSAPAVAMTATAVMAAERAAARTAEVAAEAMTAKTKFNLIVLARASFKWRA